MPPKLKNRKELIAASSALLDADPGFLELDEGESLHEITQKEILRHADLQTANKHFELTLNDFGPYRLNYSRNGRHLLLGGRKGHVAAFDWQRKDLMCEMNVMQTVNDVKWLHIETMFAVAQKDWTYIYDNKGIELHCLKKLNKVLRLEFLPYHFLLVSANATGYLSWVDVSIGQLVADFSTHRGRLDVMCQNPSSGVVALGHSTGTVTMWTPNIKEPVMELLCHRVPCRAVTIDHTGNYMVTAGADQKIHIWDLRNAKYNTVETLHVRGVSHVSLSQRNLLSVASGDALNIFKDFKTPYLQYRAGSSVAQTQFVPYEDVLGLTHMNGMASLIVPGAGEPNFDALETNPYQTKDQRKQAEVKMLLNKIPADLISLQRSALSQVDTKTLQEVMEEKKKLLYIKPRKIKMKSRKKKKEKEKANNKCRYQQIRRMEQRKRVEEKLKNKDDDDDSDDDDDDIKDSSSEASDQEDDEKDT